MNHKIMGFACAGLVACACIMGMGGCAATQDGSASSASVSASASASSSESVDASSAEATTSSSDSASQKVSATAARADGITLIGADEVANRDADTYLVDARTPEEYDEGHIPGALNASYPKSTGGPCQAEENATAFRNAWAELDIPADAKVILYCRTSNRSSAAASALAEDGYTNLSVYEGGWTDWSSDPLRPIEE